MERAKKLLKRPHCATLIWLDAQEQVGEIEPWGPEDEAADNFKHARPASEPTLPEYTAFLSAGSRGRGEGTVRATPHLVGSERCPPQCRSRQANDGR